MKIALYNLTTTTKTGGIETFNWDLARALAQSGHTVHIYGGKGDIRQAVPGNVPVFVYPFMPRERFPNFGTRFRKFAERFSMALFALRGLIKNRYDFIYIHKPFDLPAALIAAKLSGARVIFGSGGTEFFPGYGWLAGKADIFFSCSLFNASQIERYCGLKPAVLYNGIDTGVFKPLAPDTGLKEKLGIKDEAVMVTACRLIGLKGVQHAIGAVSLLKGRHRIRYLIAGEGEYRGRLEKAVKDLGLDKEVAFLGRVPNHELPRYYSMATLAVFPSVADEAFGISIAEAMACGAPVVSTAIGGIPEVVSNGTGILTPPRDERALAAAIEKLITEPALREAMGRAARKRVEENFVWERAVKKIEEHAGRTSGRKNKKFRPA